jgi:hypothetical protein
MTAERLVAKMQLQEELDWRQKREERKRQLAQPKPVNKAEANISTIVQLRKKTAAIDYELETQRTLAAESKRHQEASVALYLANLTPQERAERDEDTRRMQLYAAQYCKEAGPDWRQQAQEVFAKKRL